MAYVGFKSSRAVKCKSSIVLYLISMSIKFSFKAVIAVYSMDHTSLFQLRITTPLHSLTKSYDIFQDGGGFLITFLVNNVLRDLRIIFSVNPFKITIAVTNPNSPSPDLTPPLTSDFDVHIKCVADSLKIYFNSEQMASIVAFHSNVVNGQLVQPILTKVFYDLDTVLKLGRMAWNYSTSNLDNYSIGTYLGKTP